MDISFIASTAAVLMISRHTQNKLIPIKWASPARFYLLPVNKYIEKQHRPLCVTTTVGGQREEGGGALYKHFLFSLIIITIFIFIIKRQKERKLRKFSMW